ncbi:MAG TPA: hypothetical protein VMR88_07820 [Candidatus Polarisedimenticolaceae bacterium]|nr:hypothetical protein [Candidatus Polarisedimenticolaceae bacterium]
MYSLPPGTYIAALAIVAFCVALWPPKKRWAQALILSISLLFTAAEIHNSHNTRIEHEKQQAQAREAERKAFKSIADSIANSMSENQKAVEAAVDGMKGLAAITKDTVNEATGGDSFCFVDMIPIPEGLMAHLVQKGKYPVFDVRLTVTDLNALDSAIKSGAPSLLVGTRTFGTIDFLSRDLWQPLGVYPMDPKEEYVRYNISIFARNGSFTELLRLRRLKEGGWTSALLVHASYDTKKGIVFERIQRQFPVELLEKDQDWKALKKSKVIKVAD